MFCWIMSACIIFFDYPCIMWDADLSHTPTCIYHEKQHYNAIPHPPYQQAGRITLTHGATRHLQGALRYSGPDRDPCRQ